MYISDTHVNVTNMCLRSTCTLFFWCCVDHTLLTLFIVDHILSSTGVERYVPTYAHTCTYMYMYCMRTCILYIHVLYVCHLAFVELKKFFPHYALLCFFTCTQCFANLLGNIDNTSNGERLFCQLLTLL